MNELSAPLLWATMLAPSLRQRLSVDWLRASIAGGLLFCVHQVLYFSSLKLTTVANVTIIGALQPIVVLLAAALLFGERVTTARLFWSVIAFAGTLAVVLGATHPAAWSPLGDALAIAVVPGSIGHALSNWAHAHVSTFVASMILLAVPVVATIGALPCSARGSIPFRSAAGCWCSPRSR